MRKGCIITVAILGLVLMAAAYGIWRLSSTVMDVPDDLVPFKDGETALALITSTTPAPTDSARLTAEDVALYIRGLDSVSAGWRPIKTILDSLVRAGDFGIKDSNSSILTNLDLMHEMVLFIPRTNAGIVHYLNEHGLSADRYSWIRRRVIAASGISVDEVNRRVDDSLFKPMRQIVAQRGPDDTFTPIYPADSTEVALVAPVRDRLLREGLMSLAHVESFLFSKKSQAINIQVD